MRQIIAEHLRVRQIILHCILWILNMYVCVMLENAIISHAHASVTFRNVTARANDED